MKLSRREMQLLKGYKRGLRRAFGRRLKCVRLFGSWARGEATDDSDIDILVVVDALTRQEKNRSLDNAYDLSVANNRMLSPLIVDTRWYALLKKRQRLLASEIACDGIDI